MKENCASRALDYLNPQWVDITTTPTVTGDEQAEAIDVVFTAAEITSRIKRVDYRMRHVLLIAHCPLNIALHLALCRPVGFIANFIKLL